MIRVLLLEDHASFRQALASIIEREPDVTVVAQAGSLAEARALLPQEVDIAACQAQSQPNLNPILNVVVTTVGYDTQGTLKG
jgi:DNA-binding NarL/FixJ family response regulator